MSLLTWMIFSTVTVHSIIGRQRRVKHFYVDTFTRVGLLVMVLLVIDLNVSGSRDKWCSIAGGICSVEEGGYVMIGGGFTGSITNVNISQCKSRLCIVTVNLLISNSIGLIVFNWRRKLDGKKWSNTCCSVILTYFTRVHVFRFTVKNGQTFNQFLLSGVW